MDYNRETVLDELNDFEKRSIEISPVLEEYLIKVAKSGDTMFPWIKMKPLLRRKLELVLDDFYETCPTDNLPPLPNVESFKYDILKTKILEAIDSFQSAPFTIQRICELLTSPHKHYKRTDKFMRGLEKNVLVVSTIEPKSRMDNEVNNNSNTNVMVNGLISNDQIGKENSSTPNSNSSLKLNNSASQFDNFGVLSASPSIIITEIPSVSQKDNDEKPESLKDLNSNITNDCEMDANSFQSNCDNHLTENETKQGHTESSDNSSPDDSTNLKLQNSCSAPLDNFAVFSTPSSLIITEIPNVTQNEKCGNQSSEKELSSNNNSECNIKVNSFQSSSNAHLVDNAMDITPSSAVSDEQESYNVEQDCSPPLTPSHCSVSDEKEFVQDLCFHHSQEERTSAIDSQTSSENCIVTTVTAEDETDTSLTVVSSDKAIITSGLDDIDDCQENCEVGEKEKKADSLANSQPVEGEVQTKLSSGDISSSQSRTRHRDVTTPVVLSEYSEVEKNNIILTNHLPEQDPMDMESPPPTCGNGLHDFDESNTDALNTSETEAMEQD